MSKWQVKLKGSAAKSLKSLDTGTKQRIERFIDRLIETDNPVHTARRCKESDMLDYGVIGLEIIG